MSMGGRAKSGSRRSGRGRIVLIAVVIALVGLAASATIGIARSSSIRDLDQRSFQSTAANLDAALRAKLETATELTATMGAIAAMEPNAGQTRYLRWYDELQRDDFANLQGADAALIVPVPASQLASFERAVMSDPAFRARVGSAGYHVIPAGNRSFYCLGRALVGQAATLSSYPATLDYCAPELPLIGASPFRALIRTIADSGGVVVTPVPLSIGGSLVAIGAAVYRPGMALATVAERRAAVVGYIATTLDASTLVGSVIAAQRSVALALYHRNAG